MSAEQFHSGEKRMASYEIRTSRHSPDNVIAWFSGLGSVTFQFDPATGSIVHEAFETSDSSERGTALQVLGKNRLENARAAALTHYRAEQAPIPEAVPRTQGELNF